MSGVDDGPEMRTSEKGVHILNVLRRPAPDSTQLLLGKRRDNFVDSHSSEGAEDRALLVGLQPGPFGPSRDPHFSCPFWGDDDTVHWAKRVHANLT